MVMGSLPWWGVRSGIRWALGRSWGPGLGALGESFLVLSGLGGLYKRLEYRVHLG